MTQAFAELEKSVHAALETYSNVHRGSGHSSLASTHLYEQAREIVLESLGLNKDKYMVIFCTPRRAEVLKAQLKPGSYQCLSSQDDRPASLGVRALAVETQGAARAAFPSRPAAGRPGWSPPAGSSGPRRRTSSRPARLPSSTSSPLPGRCSWSSNSARRLSSRCSRRKADG